jgi:hypothetical protein
VIIALSMLPSETSPGRVAPSLPDDGALFQAFVDAFITTMDLLWLWMQICLACAIHSRLHGHMVP